MLVCFINAFRVKITHGVGPLFNCYPGPFSNVRCTMMLFELYPDLKKAYWLSQDLRAIFNRKSTKDSARLNLARWYNRVADSGFKSFNTIAATFYEHSDEILNFYDNRSTNASAESINSKIKAFRAKLHGVNDTKFFIFRLCNIYASRLFHLRLPSTFKNSAIL